MRDKYAEVCEECLKEMFKRVGEKWPNPKLTEQDEWYQQRSWTEKEEDDFRKWMDNLLKKRLRMNKKTRDLEISMFMLNWGWTTKENK